MSNFPSQIDPLDPSAAMVAEAAAEDARFQAQHRTERVRRIKLSVASSLAIRPLSFLVPLVTMPLFLRYLGPERYGLFETVGALAAWLGMTNFGLGMGLMNRLTELDVRGDRQTARLYTSTLTLALALMTLIMIGLVSVVVWFVPWAELLGVEAPVARREVTPAVWIAATLTLLGMIATVAPAIYTGYQETHRNNIWDGIARGAMLLASIGVVLWPGLGTIGVLAASIGAPTLVRLINLANMFLREKPWLRPSLRLFDWDALKSMGSQGILLFVLASSAVLLFQTDRLIIAWGLGAEHVTPYAILGRLFVMGQGLFMMLLLPFWPASGEALRRGDLAWVRRNVRRASILGCTMMLLGGVVLLVARGPLTEFLRYLANGQDVPISASLVLAMTATFVARAWVDSRSTVTNAAGILIPQIPFYTGHAVLNLIVSAIVVRRFGVEGVAWSTAITGLLTSVWGYPWLLKRYIWTRMGPAA